MTLRYLMAVSLLSFFIAGSSSAFTLITEEEFLQEGVPDQTPAIQIIEKSLALEPDAPLIKLMKPNISSVVSNPFDVELLFSPVGEAKIVIESLKIVYEGKKFGMRVSKDVTKKILKHAKVVDTGIFAPEVKIHKGKHVIIVEIRDSKDRISREKFSFTIGS